MVPYYLNTQGDAPYSHGMFRDNMDILFDLDQDACRSAPRIAPEFEADSVARNREIDRLPFSWVT